MKQYIIFAAIFLLMTTACQETADLPVFAKPVAQTEMGKKIVESGIIAILHDEVSTSPVAGLTESYFNYLSIDGYLAKIYLYEVDLKTSGINVAVCNANNSNSTSTFASQNLSDQVKLIDSESNKVWGAVNGGSYASNNSKPYGILVKNGTVLKSSATSTGNNANTVFFAVTKAKNAIIANFNEIGTSVNIADLNNAVGGKAWLIQDNVIISLPTESKIARTAIGITNDNRVFIMVVDAGQYFTSTGITGLNAAKLLSSLGVNNAILLNDGNSTTFISRFSNELILKNSPPNQGAETKINNGLVIVEN